MRAVLCDGILVLFRSLLKLNAFFDDSTVREFDDSALRPFRYVGGMLARNIDPASDLLCINRYIHPPFPRLEIFYGR